MVPSPHPVRAPRWGGWSSVTVSPSRKPHFLKPNKTSATIHHIIAIDTETSEHPTDGPWVEHCLVLGWAHYSRRLPNGKWSKEKSLEFRTREALVGFIEAHARPRERLILLAHNWSYDAQVLDLLR